MVRQLLPQMKARKNKKEGAILMVSSMAGYIAGAFGNNYHASKAYVTMFGRCLHNELKYDGIDVLAYCPAMVDTKLIKDVKDKNGSGGMITTEQAVSVSLRDLGIDSHSVGAFGHSLQLYMFGLFPMDLFMKSIVKATVKMLNEDPKYDWIRDQEKQTAKSKDEA